VEHLKICSFCGKEKPINHFYKNRNTRDGLSTRCKDCRHITEAVQRQTYYLANSEKIKAYRKEYNKKYKSENREYLRQMERLRKQKLRAKAAREAAKTDSLQLKTTGANNNNQLSLINAYQI